MASVDYSLFVASEDDSRKDKSPSALRTISEASDMLDIPQHVLRFWETKFSQIKPLKRNGGRRFYRPQDLEVLQQIKHLLYNQGYTIKGARKAIDEFLHTRHEQPVSAQEWMESVPAANVNDNYSVINISTSERLAELAEALREEEPQYAPLPSESPLSGMQRDALIELRAELVAMRSQLRDTLERVQAA